jgi:hypothetical protein
MKNGTMSSSFHDYMGGVARRRTYQRESHPPERDSERDFIPGKHLDDGRPSYPEPEESVRP